MSREHTVDCVLDTSVMTQILSDRDFHQDYARANPDKDEVQLMFEGGEIDDRTLHRIRRMRAAWLAVMVMHERGWSSLVHEEETKAVVDPRAPEPEASSLWIEWPQLFRDTVDHFVREQVVPGWQPVKHHDEPPPADAEKDEIDGWLLGAAKQFGVPLITDEGVGLKGTFYEYQRSGNGRRKGDLNLRGRARAEGVEVYSPIEFVLASGLDVDDLVEGFLQRFADGFTNFVARRHPNIAGGAEAVSQVYRQFEVVFAGRMGEGFDDLDVRFPEER